MAPRFNGSRRRDGRVLVWIDDPETDRHETLQNVALHKSKTFEWGYLGSGPTALAASMCAAVSVGSPVGPVAIDFVKREKLQDLGREWKLPFSAIVDSMARSTGAAGQFNPEAARVD